VKIELLLSLGEWYGSCTWRMPENMPSSPSLSHFAPNREVVEGKMGRILFHTSTLSIVVYVFLIPRILSAEVSGVAPGIPEPDRRNVIVQLFNWRFTDIEEVIPRLKELG